MADERKLNGSPSINKDYYYYYYYYYSTIYVAIKHYFMQENWASSVKKVSCGVGCN